MFRTETPYATTLGRAGALQDGKVIGAFETSQPPCFGFERDLTECLRRELISGLPGSRWRWGITGTLAYFPAR